MRNLLIASNNQGKLQEIKAILGDLPLEIVTPQQINLALEVPEDGTTYKENATKKAQAFSNASGLVSLADDTGLEVDALGGLPGLHSARFAAKENATDLDRRQKLLSHLEGKPKPWTARFKCVVAIAALDGKIYFTEGACDGEIIPDERGEGGFGYDKIFLLTEFGLTMAQLSSVQKNQISHRAKAVSAANPILAKLFQVNPSSR